MSSFWRIWFIVWAWSIITFGVIIAGGAFEATSGPIGLLYDFLQGRAGSVVFDPAMRFSLGVMGAVSIGWGVTTLMIIRAAIALGDRAQPLWNAITGGILAWFVIDSILSVATGFGLNVIPNIALLGGYLIAMLATGNLMKTAG